MEVVERTRSDVTDVGQEQALEALKYSYAEVAVREDQSCIWKHYQEGCNKGVGRRISKMPRHAHVHVDPSDGRLDLYGSCLSGQATPLN